MIVYTFREARAPGRTSHTGRTSQAMLEFALAIPILLLLIMGIMDGGRWVIAETTLVNATREAARFAVVRYPNVDWNTGGASAGRNAAVGLAAQDLGIAVSTEISGQDSYVVVHGQYTFRPITPGLTWLTAQIPMNAQTRMLVQ
ncbi:MAG: TadE-like protein [Chloroflexota bacterium]|jgi:Flp pilus assembly protein TadG|nr:TadE-like protein [Chloroflexota bacterium]